MTKDELQAHREYIKLLSKPRKDYSIKIEAESLPPKPLSSYSRKRSYTRMAPKSGLSTTEDQKECQSTTNISIANAKNKFISARGTQNSFGKMGEGE